MHHAACRRAASHAASMIDLASFHLWCFNIWYRGKSQFLSMKAPGNIGNGRGGRFHGASLDVFYSFSRDPFLCQRRRFTSLVTIMRSLTSLLSFCIFANSALSEITCGVCSGYDRGVSAYFYSGDGSLADFDSCSGKCQSDTRCESFAFGDSQCLLYSEPL